MAGACPEVRGVGLGDQGRAGHLWEQEGPGARGRGGGGSPWIFFFKRIIVLIFIFGCVGLLLL